MERNQLVFFPVLINYGEDSRFRVFYFGLGYGWKRLLLLLTNGAG